MHLAEDQDDVIGASGAPREIKLGVPHGGLGTGEFLAEVANGSVDVWHFASKQDAGRIPLIHCP